MTATAEGRAIRRRNIADFIAVALEKYPSADDTEVDVLVGEVEAEISGTARTLASVISLFRPLLTTPSPNASERRLGGLRTRWFLENAAVVAVVGGGHERDR